MFRTYSAVLSVRGARLPMAASLVGTVPIGMLALGMVLATRAGTGSYSLAGIIAGSVGLGNAVGLVAQGRAMTRLGLSGPLAASSVWRAGALVTFAAAVARDADPSLLAGLGFLAGAAIPATTAAMRAFWPTLVTDAGTLMAATPAIRRWRPARAASSGNAAGGHLVDSYSRPVTFLVVASILGGVAAWTRLAGRWHLTGGKDPVLPGGA